jgi:hypothetical protein
MPEPGQSRSRQLHERDEAIKAVSDAFVVVRSGGGVCLFFVGDPGQGKSTILRMASERAEAESFSVLHASGNSMETDLPFAFAEQFFGYFSDADEAVLGAIGGSEGADPESMRVPDGEALGRRAQVYALARTRLRQQAERVPTLIVLDDLQWADPDSLSLLSYLIRRLADLPVAVVGALRSWPPGALDACALWQSEGLAEVVTLNALSEGATQLAELGALSAVPPSFRSSRCQTQRTAISVDDGNHGDRDEEPWSVDPDLADAAGWSDLRKEFIEHISEAVGVFGAHEQCVNHHCVRKLRACGAQDRLTVPHCLAGLFFNGWAGELAGLHIDACRPGDIHGVSRLHRLAVKGRFRRIGSRDDLLRHGQRSSR